MVNLLRVLLTLSVLLFAGVATAQPDGDDLRALNARAAELEAAGDWQGALEIHRQIFVRSRGKPPWNWASNHSNAAYKAGGADAEAARLMRIALQGLPPTEPNYEELKEKFDERMALLLTKVGRLRITVTPEGAEILVDGTSVGRAPLADEVFVLPGSRELQAHLEGYRAARELVTLGGGEVRTVTLTLEPATATPSPGPTQRRDDGLSPTRLGVGIAGIALGVGGAVAAIILGVTAADRSENVDDLILTSRELAPNGSSCGEGSPAHFTNVCGQIEQQAREQLRFQGAAIGAGIAGGVLLIGGILMLALPSESSDAEIGLHAGPGSAGLELRGRF